HSFGQLGHRRRYGGDGEGFGEEDRRGAGGGGGQVGRHHRGPGLGQRRRQRAGDQLALPAGQSAAQALAGAGQAGGDGALGAAEPVGRLAAAQALEVTEDDRNPVLLRQAADGGVQLLAQVEVGRVARGSGHVGRQQL